MGGMLITLVLLGLLARALWGRRRDGGGDLPALLASAERAGIVSAEQRERLLAHAAERAPAAGPGGAVWLAIFAGLFVAAGVALLIAANWASIGAPVRVVAFLMLLGLAGEAAVRARARPAAVGVPLELVWLFLPLLGIGLYAQTFQLSGDPIRPYLVWLALTAPLAWLGRHPIVAGIHTAAVVAVLFTGNFGVEGTLALTVAPHAPGARLAAWALSLALLGVVVVQSQRLLPEGHRHHVLGVAAAWVFAVLAAPTALALDHEGWLAFAAVALATLWLVVLLATPASAPERMSAALVWLGVIYALSFVWHASRAPEGEPTAGGVAITIVAAVAALGGVLLLPGGALGAGPRWSAIARTLLVLPLPVALLLLTGDVELVWLAAVLCNVLLVAIAIAFMWHGSLAREIAEINLGILVLVLVLVTRFLDVLGSFVQGGVGFIVAGVLLAGLAWALQRTRQRLIGRPGEAG